MSSHLFLYCLQFIKSIANQRQLIGSLAKREVKTLYVGSLLGIFWAFIHPLIMISVFWFIFSVGFRVKPLGDVPFVVWLTAGMAPWFYFSDIIVGSASSVITHANLVKKTLFPSEILPVIKVTSSFVSHSFFLLILLLLLFFQEIPFSLFFFQGVYYLFCLWALSLGIGLILAPLNVFIRDISHLVNVLIQIGFWATPIFWDINMMPVVIQKLLKLNPVYYVVQGYRDSFIYGIPFWHHPAQTFYFWLVTTVIFISGTMIFLKLKPQFADVL
ncbi:ABC transporter permease [Desulfogranum marinum]|uniref:ABC transporter permease n=1 Tax=Desulfogranum marinum TaxID=453220 RepID=UPI0029C8CEB2|nr:ABC transporter permease [Desulfogranum marinum]